MTNAKIERTLTTRAARSDALRRCGFRSGRRGERLRAVVRLLARTAPWFRDAVAVELEVTPDNARARALYQRLGFAPLKNAVMRALL